MSPDSNEIATGVPHKLVHSMLVKMEDKLFALLEGEADIIHVAAWVHNMYVAIHPMYNQNGRYAVSLANAILTLHGYHYVLRWEGYGDAVAKDLRNFCWDTEEVPCAAMEKYISTYAFGKLCHFCDDGDTPVLTFCTD